MLPKKCRLPIQFFIKKSGKIYRSRFFLLKVFASNLAYCRFGVVVSKKVAPKAVDRNRLKRFIFNFLKERAGSMISNDYLLILSPGANELTKEELLKELELVFGF